MDLPIATNKSKAVGQKRRADEISSTSTDGGKQQHSTMKHPRITRSMKTSSYTIAVQKHTQKVTSKSTFAEDDENDAMAVTNLPDKVVKLNKPRLNYDILPEIFLEAVHNEETLHKFMLSGKQFFLAALKCFRYPKDVIIDNTHIVLKIKPSPEKTKDICIGFDAPMLLKVLLELISSSMESLVLLFDNGVWNHNPCLKKIKYICRKLLSSNFKTLVFRHTFIPAEFKEILMKNQSIQVVQRSTSFDIPILPPSCQELIISHLCFRSSIKEDIVYSNIKKLVLKGYFYHYYNLHRFLALPSYIFKHFHNLTYMDIHVKILRQREFPYMFDLMFDTDGIQFQDFPLTIKGNIQLVDEQNYVYKYLNFIDRARNDEDLNVDETDEQIIVTKKFEIHDGLNFIITASFTKQRPRSSSLG